MPVSTEDQIWRYDWGGPEGAPLLLLLHGFSDSGQCWNDAVARWTPAYRVVTVDLRGHEVRVELDPNGTLVYEFPQYMLATANTVAASSVDFVTLEEQQAATRGAASKQRR